MFKKWMILGTGILILVIVISGVYLWKKTLSHNENTSSPTVIPAISQSAVTSTPSRSSAAKANIIITSPKSMETVTLPITIKGEARVFENQFNYLVRDVNKNIILEGSAYADSSNEGQFGSYSIKISSLPTMRANAITLEVFDYSAKDGKEIDTVSIPVVFDPANTIPIKAYFGSKQAPAGQECTTVYPVEHHIAKTQSTARAALEELLNGPIIIEKNNGYYTNINDEVKIQKLTIENGEAKVDFNKRLEEGIGGSCKVAAIRAQITQTLKQFPTVKNVVISIDGRTEDILQP